MIQEIGLTARQSARTWAFLTLAQRRVLLAALVLMAGVGFLSARIPLILGQLVDAMLAHRLPTLAAAAPVLGLLAATYVGREVMQVIRKIVVERTSTQVERDATVRAVSSLLYTELSILGAERAGTLNGRLHRSVEHLVRLLKLSFLDLFPALFGASFALIASLQKNLTLGLLMSAIVPIGLVIILAQLTSQRGIRTDLLKAKELVDGTVVEQLGGIESVRAAHTADLEIGKVAAIADDLSCKEFRHHRAMALFDAAKSLNEGGFHIAVITVAIWLALTHQISAGDILAFSMLFVAIVTPLREVHRIIDEASESGIKAAEFFAMVDAPMDPAFAAQGELPGATDPHRPIIECRDLRVDYPGAEGIVRPALNGVSMSIREGAVIGLAGPSGSGKSTFAKTLLRLVTTTGGSLSVGGQPIEVLSRAAIGRSFGYVSQEPHLFSGSVAENIAYLSQGATREAVRTAARSANIAREIEAWPEGYDRQLTERGRNLSPGQRQRIALARVFLQNPRILILDEATAALDNTNEKEVMEAMSRAAIGRTVIMVAHRLTSLAAADHIYVFKDGAIAEEGRYDDLANRRSGEFAALLQGSRAA